MYKTNMYHYGIIVKREFALPALCQKSFYGKASVIESVEGEIFLRSYDTLVCYIDKGGKFRRLWCGYSRTTANHINDFRSHYGLDKMSKKEWDQMVVR